MLRIGAHNTTHHLPHTVPTENEDTIAADATYGGTNFHGEEGGEEDPSNGRLWSERKR